MKNQTNHTAETGYGMSAIAKSISRIGNSAFGIMFAPSDTKTDTSVLTGSPVVCFTRTFVSSAGSFGGYSTVIIPGAGALVSCDVIFVSNDATAVSCASACVKPAGVYFCNAAAYVLFGSGHVGHGDLFVNATCIYFCMRSVPVSVTRVFVNTGSEVGSLYCAFVSNRIGLVNSTGVYFDSGCSPDSETGALVITGNVFVKPADVYFSGRNVFDKGNNMTDTLLITPVTVENVSDCGLHSICKAGDSFVVSVTGAVTKTNEIENNGITIKLITHEKDTEKT